jgi:hypothetical protein
MTAIMSFVTGVGVGIHYARRGAALRRTNVKRADVTRQTVFWIGGPVESFPTPGAAQYHLTP